VPETGGSEPVSLQAPGQLDQRQLLSMLTGASAAPSSAAVAPSATATGGISAANLSAILAGIGRGAGAGVQVKQLQCRLKAFSKKLLRKKFVPFPSLEQRGHIQEGPSLSDVLEPRALSEALASLSPEVIILMRK
jgi:hypothetical protein